MEDRHLYRGKRKDNGEWIVGNVAHNTDGSCQILDKSQNPTWWEYVDPATVGRCTGRKFSNRLAFEEDIFHIPDDMTDIVVRWSDYELAFMAESVRDGEEVYLNEYDGDEMYWIGNIHDNPELLEEGEE